MKMVFGFKDDWDLVQNGIEPLGDCAIDKERVAHKEKKHVIHWRKLMVVPIKSRRLGYKPWRDNMSFYKWKKRNHQLFLHKN